MERRYDDDPVLYESGPHRFWRTLGHWRWAFPLVMLLLGFIPDMQGKVWGTPFPYFWMFVSLVAMIIWLIAEIVTTASGRTGTRHLQLDDAISLAVFGIISYLAGTQKSGLEWWIVIPWVGATIDAILSGFLGINNAAQKPYNPNSDKREGPY